MKEQTSARPFSTRKNVPESEQEPELHPNALVVGESLDEPLAYLLVLNVSSKPLVGLIIEQKLAREEFPVSPILEFAFQVVHNRSIGFDG